MLTVEIFNKGELYERYMGDIVVIKEVIEIFIKSVEEKMDLLAKAIEKKDFNSIKFNAHSIKGQAYNMSAKKLGDIALDIERAIKESDIEKIKILFDELSLSFLEVKDILVNTKF